MCAPKLSSNSIVLGAYLYLCVTGSAMLLLVSLLCGVYMRCYCRKSQREKEKHANTHHTEERRSTIAEVNALLFAVWTKKCSVAIAVNIYCIDITEMLTHAMLAQRLSAACALSLKFAEILIESDSIVNDEWTNKLKFRWKPVQTQ